ncbi:tenascin isoform X2 [Electrophorus electricus]|uniref:tenascin isoform X2 n=1 Tax=Electrophorus electricus TaxID=8005 RepID=UPI0015D05196|nr:tenascin isoform X2 [Electrophorus electricus]
MGTQDLLLRCLLFATLMTLNQSGLVKKVLQHQRQEMTVPSTQNVTQPSPEKSFIYSHVYNINVPASSFCSVDLDSPGLTELEPRDATVESQATDYAFNRQNEIVFTHRINIPKQACGCTDGHPELRELLNRLEMLEDEVSTLRERCGGHSTCCGAQVTGEVGTKPYCSGHGNYSTEICACICDKGWKGPNCTLSDCPNDCSNQGHCVDGKCKCFDGYSGKDCSMQICIVDCGSNGQCINGICVCAESFSGDDCSKTACLNNCLGRGHCVDGDCVCYDPWTGFDCSELICPNDCYDRGLCVNGTCLCDKGFRGEDCGERVCTKNCTGHGRCVDGKCICNPGYTGEDCATLTCPNNCNERGHCFNGICICNNGYQGEDCGVLSCLNNCFNRGQCVNGKCECNAGFQGDDCSELSCPNNCNNQGRCVKGQCVCVEGVGAEDCSVKTCSSDCSGQGQCVDGTCVCFAGFWGEDCSELSCPNNCLHHGHCVGGQCICDEGFTGEDCSQLKCVNDCLGHGHCVDGHCICMEGYTGEDCSITTCPANCNNHGHCIKGVCLCDEDFGGNDCSERKCPKHCHGLGQCVDGQCVCNEGYIGEDCSEVSPPKDLSISEITPKTVNLTWTNEMLVKEYLITYIPTSSDGLQLDVRVPGDLTTATITEIEPGIEYSIHVYAILDNKKSIPVGTRVATNLPQPEGLKFKSIGETSVEVFWEQLDIPLDGWVLTFRNTKEENGKIVNTLPPSQTHFEQSGLGPGQQYEVSVSIIKNNIKGIPLSRTIVTRIDAPDEVEVRDVTDTSAMVSWSRPVAEVDKFIVSYGPAKVSSAWHDMDVHATIMQHILEGLEPDTDYQVSISSKKGDIASEPIYESFTTGLDAPQDLQIVGQTDDSITVKWKNSRAFVDGYHVKYGPVTGDTLREDMVPKGLGDTTHATFTDLKPGTEYVIGVTAVKNEKESQPATASAVTGLDAPRDLEAIEVTETTMVLLWKKPRANITNYRLVFVFTDGQWEELSLPADATTYTQKHLVPGKHYNITLVAEHGQRKSAPATLTASTASFTFYLANSFPELNTTKDSDDNFISFTSLEISESQRTGTGHEDLPGTLTVSNITSDGFDISWVPKPHILFDSYIVEIQDFSGKFNHEVHLHGQAASSRIHDLHASTKYQIRLYGISNSQRSSPLEAVAITAPQSTSPDVVALNLISSPTKQPTSQTDPVYTPVTEEANVIGSVVKPEGSTLPNLKVSDVTQTSLKLSWSEPEEAFDSFLVELVSVSDMSKVNVTNISGGARDVQILHLVPGMLYNINFYGLWEGKKIQLVNAHAKTEQKKPLIESVTVSDVSWGSFNVSWSTEKGSAFENFVIEVAESEGGQKRQNFSLSGDSQSLRITGLSPNTSYTIALYGVYQGYLFEPLHTEAITVSMPAVGNLYVSNVTSESFSIAWNGTKGSFDGFILEIIDSSSLREPDEYNLSCNAVSYNITGLMPSTDYIAYLSGVVKGTRIHTVSAFASTAAEPDLSGLVVSNITSDRLSLSWRMGEKMYDNFIVEVRESALPSQAMGRSLPIGARSTVLSGLKGDTQYHIKLYATSGNHNSAPLTTVVTTEPKAQLGAIMVSDIYPNNFTLSWSTMKGHFDGFVIRVSDQEQLHDIVELKPSGVARNVTVSGLVDSTVYDVLLYGISHGGRTPTVSLHTTTASLPKVENVTVSDITPFGFRVSWTAQSSEGFSHFQLKVSDFGQLLEPQEFLIPGNQNSLEIWGLITGIGYEINLTGVSQSGLQSRSVTTEAVTEAEPEIEHLFVSDVTPESFRLAWTAEDIFDRFVIKVRDSKKLIHPQEFNVPGDERTKVLTKLTGGTEYEIEIYGVTLEHRSQPLTAVARTGLGAPQGIHFSEVTDTSAIVHWNMPREMTDTFRITYVPLQGGDPAIVTEVDGSQSQTQLTNLIPGETYQVTAIAMKGLEESDPVSDILTTNVDMPQNLTAVSITDIEALLQWQPPVAKVDGYVITYLADTVEPVMKWVSGNTVEFEINSLHPATQYTVSIYATTDSQKSAPANTNFTTDVDAPWDLVASNIQTDSAVLTWKPPRTPIESYVLSFESSDGIIRELILDPSATSHRLLKLNESTQYTVKLNAVFGPDSNLHQSQIVSTKFTTVGLLYKNPKDCSQTLLNGETTSGLYTIYPGGYDKLPVLVYCDMTTDGGGWLVVLRRQNGNLDFYRNWKNYTSGFGDVNNEFWLGLSNLHTITASSQYELRVDLRDGQESAYAQYDRLYVGEPRSRYKLQTGAYSGTAGDSLIYHQNRPFSTYDNDNDLAITNCALSYKGAFWYKNCHHVNLMGRYGDNSHSKGINWFHWKGHEHSIPFVEMKIRPVNFRNLEDR